MKELIGKLSRGQIEYALPKADVSVTSIEQSIEAGTVFDASFDVFNQNEGEMKGIVYSTNEYVKIVISNFIGKTNTINYVLDTKVLEQGDIISGRFNVVSNGGEIYIPFKFEIIPEGIPSSIGSVSNMFHFINLVKQDYDEALKMFYSEDFERIILKENLTEKCMYQGLIKGANRKRALEEFIIAINKKQRVDFEISDTLREYDSLTASYGDLLVITRNTWGLLDIEVSTDCEFITDFKAVITEEDFAGNRHEFKYLIDINRLHNGMNYGKIIFKSMNKTLECVISVDNVKERDLSGIEVKKCLIEINRLYIDFRTRKRSIDQWADESLKMIDRARGFDDSDPFLRLLQAQVNISKKKDKEAEWLIDSVTEEVARKKDENISLYCYYLYIKALQKRELEYTVMVTETIRKYYESGYDNWELLWILLYIDHSYENNKSLKLARIKEQYKLGCRSTLMYYEALYVLNKQSQLLRMLNSFELQVLNFGTKYGIVDLRLAVQVSEVALHEKKFRPLLFRILKKLYEKFENKVILNAIISILIRGNMTDEQYFEWYELGVRSDLQVTRLYEYYVFAMPRDEYVEIPEQVFRYFNYNADLLYDRKAFYYSLIIRDKEINPGVYKNYKENIEQFGLEMLRIGKTDEYLDTIYADVLNERLITKENEKMLPKVLNTWKITINNKRIKEVIVHHKEIAGEDVYSISKGSAYVHIYTEDAVIIFKDYKGNLYMNTIDYKIRRFMNSRELHEVAMARNKDNIYVMAKECEQSLKYHKLLVNGAKLFSFVMDDKRFKKEYKDYILQDVITYFLNNYEDEELDYYMRHLDESKLSRKSRIPVVELMIMRGLYAEAFQILVKYGTYGIDEKKLLKLSTYALVRDEDLENDEIELYCNVAFKKGKYNESSLKYLGREFNGTTKEMYELWRISREFSIENRDLEERLIAQMLFTRTGLSSICVVYDSYYRKGALSMIRNAYLFYESYNYFVLKKKIDEMFFRHLEDEILSSDTVHDVCRCAYLLKNSERVNIKQTTKQMCKENISYLEKKGIIFDFFKRFENWFNISYNILDKTTIEYRTEPGGKVIINYYIDKGNFEHKEYVSDEMKQVFPGMYIKSFTVFYGEKINYSITKVTGDETLIDESAEHILDDRGVETNASRYGRLNDILVCRDLKEESIVSSLSMEYYVDNEMVKKLFGKQ